MAFLQSVTKGLVNQQEQFSTSFWKFPCSGFHFMLGNHSVIPTMLSLHGVVNTTCHLDNTGTMVLRITLYSITPIGCCPLDLTITLERFGLLLVVARSRYLRQGCNYLSLSEIPASGNKVLIYQLQFQSIGSHDQTWWKWVGHHMSTFSSSVIFTWAYLVI